MSTFDILSALRKLTYFRSSLCGIFIQAVVLLALLRRRKVVAPGPLADVPVAYIVLRDGSLSFIAMLGQFRSYPTEHAVIF
jgi:hypothetical protein